MNSTTITIGLVVLALAVGGWILLRGGKEEDEELEEAGAGTIPAGTPAPVAQPRPPTTAATAGTVPMAGTMGAPQAPGTMGMAAPAAPAPAAAVPAAAPMSSVPYGGGYAVTAPLTSEAHAYEVRTRWQELQLRFVDDPQTAAGEAERLIDDALAGVTASLNARKDQLSSWRASGRDDTEQLRAAVHGYRDFLNHLVGA
ncbi:hypothetical protein [Dactylosporangium sp. CS-033363]|uniref:hypothetical protein n=1 Tax=Dactylosporangium sp. CS-033363 TaxID=3239935 RepID=UPI003D8C8CC5